jgi:gliding motility-associated-like protein
LSDHSLMIVSTKFTTINGYSFLLASIDAGGGFRWQKKYFIDDHYYASFTDLVERNGIAWVAGTYNQYGPTIIDNQYTMLFKVDVATGNLLWSKGYSTPNKSYTCSGIHFYKDGLILNGFADSLVVPNNNEWSNFETLLETDLDGNIREGKLIYNATELNTPIRDILFVNPDNSLSLFYAGVETLALQPGFANLGLFLRLDADKNILWQNQYSSVTAGWLVHAAPAPSNGLAMLGQRMNSLSNPAYGFAENLILVKVDSNGKGPDPFCDVYETAATIQDMAVTPWTPGPIMITDEILQVVNHPLTMIKPNTELRYNCPDYVPLCSFLKLSGKNSVCNLKDTLEFIAHKDPSCADPVKWTYDVANIKTVYEDGGRTRLIFKTPGTYKILAEKPFPCAPLSDSIMVAVASTLVNFNLGGDTTLCTGDSITLRSGGKYSQYQWQDGSTSDTFKVKAAGQFFCLVTDSCGNVKSDTIRIDFRTSIPIGLGAPRFKCAGDSLTIIPPPGFKQYDWTPDYNLISSAGGTVVLYPAKDTSYQLTVHDNGGCAGTTQLKINVFPGSAVALGNDTAVCTGAHVVFSAGGNFQSYDWSNGSAANSIDVQVPGNYSVLATDQNNCKSSDTVALTVYPPPAVNITGGTVLCKDQNLVLDAGVGFTNYSWQDGSTQESFTAADTGFYRVQVTDPHHCVSADSIHISQYAVAPQGFLPSDTAVCLIRGGTISPKDEFAQYSWSNGETTKSIQVKTAGEFILQVVDDQGCRGTDTIHVTTKDCEPVLVCPNAFTPNGDGLNDIFRLKYPGTIDGYQMQIFNRWGQMVFSSSDPFGGWDGKYSSVLQPAGTYVWIIRSTDRSGKKQKIEGSVVLIR